jgi:hypothetical protein
MTKWKASFFVKSTRTHLFSVKKEQKWHGMREGDRRPPRQFRLVGGKPRGPARALAVPLSKVVPMEKTPPIVARAADPRRFRLSSEGAAAV